MTEEWKDIVGFPNYEVSSHSRVRNKTTQQVLKPHVITTKLKNGEYKFCQIATRRDGKLMFRCLHVLIATAFIPNPENKSTVDHIDGNGLNNDISNLRWATRQENMWNKTLGKGYHKSQYGTFRARIAIDGKMTHIGTYATEEEAHDAYVKKANEIRGASGFMRIELLD